MKILFLMAFLIGTANAETPLKSLKDGLFSISYSISFNDLDMMENSRGFVGNSTDPTAVQAMQRIVGDPENWESTLNSYSDDLSFEEKIKLASHMGGRFGNDYNYQRAEDGSGIVSIEQMLHALRSTDPGGVCRDVVRAQSQILQALGVPADNIYSLGYSTVGGNHAVLVVQDPNNPKKVIRINYGYVQETEGVTGSASLFIDGQLADAGISFRVYDSEGRPVDKLPSELGLIFREVTGTKEFTYNNSSYQLHKIVFKTKWANVTKFNGFTATGDKIDGASIDRKGKLRSMNYDIGIAYLSRSGDERQLSKLDQNAVYAKLISWFEKEIQLGSVKIVPIVGTSTEVSLIDTTVQSDGLTREDQKLDYTFSGFGGLEASVQRGSMEYRAGIMTTTYLDFKDQAAGTSDGVRPVLNNVITSVGFTYNINDESSLSGDIIVTSKAYGHSLTLKSTYRNERRMFDAGLYYRRPITDIPVFFDESTEAFGATASKRLYHRAGSKKGSGIYIGGKYEENITSDTRGLFGQVEIKF